MKNKKLIVMLITIPIVLVAAVVLWLKWLFPLKKGSKSNIFVPLWGKILLCKIAEVGVSFTVTHDTPVVSGEQVPVNNDYFTIKLEGAGLSGVEEVHTGMVTMDNGELNFTYGNIFDDAYVWLTRKLYDTDEVSYSLMLTEYKKYKDKIKTM